MRRCAIYARYSSDQQSPLSIEDQIRVCREYAASLSWLVSDEHVYTDEGISGAGIDRPGLTRLLDHAFSSTRPFDAILVDDTSRLSRRLADAVSIFERLHFAGIRIIAVSQNIDSASEQADVLVTVHGLVDSLYIKELGRKTHRGLDGQVLRGCHAGGRCFGYRIERDAKGDARLAIEPREAALVRRIFELSASGASLKQIAKIFNQEKIPTSRPRAGKQFATWCPTAIRVILHNEIYTGRLIWNRSHFVKQPGTNKRQKRPRPRTEWRIVERPDLRIIPPDLWQEVRDRLIEKKTLFGNGGHLFRRSTSSPYLLTGFLKCGFCGTNLHIVSHDRGHQFYGCPNHYARGTCENQLKVRRDRLETSLLSDLQKAVFEPEMIDALVASVAKAVSTHLDAARRSLAETERRRAAIEVEISRLTAAVAEAGHSKALLAAIADRERELAALTREIPARTSVNLAEIRKVILNGLADIRSLLNQDVSRARAELARHVKAIRLIPTIDAGGRRHYVAEGEWDLVGGFRHCGGSICIDGTSIPFAIAC